MPEDPVRNVVDLDAMAGIFPAGIVVLDERGTAVIANELAREILGRNPVGHRHLCESACTLLLPDGTPLPTEEDPLVAAMRATSGVRSFELTIRDSIRPDRAVVVSVARLRDTSGAIVVLQDAHMTLEHSQKLADLLGELETQNELLQVVLRNSDEGIALFDGTSLRLVWSNEAFRNLLGIRMDEPIERKRLQELYREAEQDGFAGILRDAAVSGTPCTRDEEERAGADGSSRFWRWSVTPVPRNDRLAYDLVLMFADITPQVLERRRVEHAVHDAELRLRQLETVLGHMTEGVIVSDTEGSLSVNPAAQRILRLPEDTPSRLHVSALLKLVQFETLEGDLPRNGCPVTQMLQGKLVRQQEMRAIKGEDRWLVAMSGQMISNDEGEPLLAVINLHDITERKELERRLAEEAELDRALNRINTAIGASLDADDILRRVTREAAEVMCADGAYVAARMSGDWVVRDGHEVCDALVGRRWDEFEAEELTLAAEAHMPIFVEDLEPDSLVPEDSPCGRGVRAMIAVPFSVRSGVGFVLGIEYRGGPRQFTKAEEDFIDKLAQSVSLSLENARLYQVEHRIAEALQESILALPAAIPNVEFAYLYRPAQDTARVGGDFYDIFEIDEHLVAFMIGDVSGKGLEAAATTSLVKNTLKAHAYEGDSPAETLAKANMIMLRTSPTESFSTVFFGLLRPIEGQVTYCGAGHPPPLLIARDGTVRQLETRCPVIGALPTARYADSHGLILPGETLLLYTDGIIEARRGKELFGEKRLVSFIEGIAASSNVWDLPQALLAEVSDFTGGHLGDDIAVLALALTAGGDS